MSEYLLPQYDAQVLTASKDLANYFETVLKHFPQPKMVSNWMMSELLRELKTDEEGAEGSSAPELQ